MVISLHHCAIGLLLLVDIDNRVICQHFLPFATANRLNVMFGRLVVALDHSRVQGYWIHGFGFLCQRSVSTLPFVLLSTLVCELLVDLFFWFYGHPLRIWYQHVVYNATTSRKHVRIKSTIELILITFGNAVDCDIICIIILLGH